MEEELARKDLPEELVEKIVAMMPFPSIFRAQVLSKSWLAKFLSVYDQDDEVASLGAASFQKQVCLRSTSWGSFYNVCLDFEGSRAYNLTSQTWHDIPRLSFLPEALQAADILGAADMLGALALLQGVVKGDEWVCVTNILTRRWKLLPPRPENDCSDVDHIHIVSHTSFPMYKVVAFCEGYGDGLLVQIYDYNTNVWESEELVLRRVRWDTPSRYDMSSVVYLDGFLFTVLNFFRPIAINVEDGTWEEIDMRGVPQLVAHCIVDLVVSNAGLLAILTENPSFPGAKERYQVVKMDWESRSFTEIARGPPPFLAPPPVNPGLAYRGDRIFVSSDEEYGPGVLAYDLQNNEWSLYPFELAISHPEISYTRNSDWNAFKYQPGLNPFAAV